MYTFAWKGLRDECTKVDSQIMLYELTRAIGEEALPNAIKLLEGLTVFAEKLYSAVAKSKKAALTGGVPSDEGGQRQPGKEA